jgi:hypothetical protein
VFRHAKAAVATNSSAVKRVAIIITQEYVRYLAMEGFEATKSLAIFGRLHAREALLAKQEARMVKEEKQRELETEACRPSVGGISCNSRGGALWYPYEEICNQTE